MYLVEYTKQTKYQDHLEVTSYTFISKMTMFQCHVYSVHCSYSFKYHLTCRPSGGRDCCSRVFPSRSSSSRAEFPGVEPDERG